MRGVECKRRTKRENSRVAGPPSLRFCELDTGVALVGAAVTAYVLGILLNQQQSNMTTWRREVRRRIEETGSADGSTAPRVTEGPLSHDSGTDGAPPIDG